MDSHTSSEYSDWTADAGINLQPSTPVSSRRRAHRRLSSSEEEEENEEEEEEKQQQHSDEEEKAEKSAKSGKVKAKKAKNKSPRVSHEVPPDVWSCIEDVITLFTHIPVSSQRPKTRPSINREVSNEFRPSAWITDFIPRKSPFVPQMGDEVCSRAVGRLFTFTSLQMDFFLHTRSGPRRSSDAASVLQVIYFRQGHEAYVEAVSRTELYPINLDKQPWKKMELRVRRRKQDCLRTTSTEAAWLQRERSLWQRIKEEALFSRTRSL